MKNISSLIRKAKRGEASNEELEYLDRIERIPSEKTDSRIIPLKSGITQITSQESPSETLSYLQQEFSARPKDTPCTDCEEHQKKPSRKSKKPKESSSAKGGDT